MTPDSRPRSADGMVLTPAMFHILLALAGGDRHGYAIMQEIERRTQGVIQLGPGTLYRSIKQLLEADLIAEVEPRTVVQNQRRVYRLTRLGRRHAAAEAAHLHDLVRWARATRVLGAG